MGFASVYLEERSIYKTLIGSEPQHDLGLIIIVPSFDEYHIVDLLNSLAECGPSECPVEVLIGVNAPEDATEEQLTQNIETIKSIESWLRDKIEIPFRLFAFNTGRATLGKWGAGLARKVLMDEACRRFNKIDNPHGVIVSLDADCLVSKNYLSELCNTFRKKDLNGISIRFEHRLPEKLDELPIRSAIIDYELHLRYYYQALLYSGYPNVYHTVGSAFAVRVSAYVKVGGMNRRQAGEDFYFIQKMLPFGGFEKNNSLVVYPSARISTRVPFGTGPAIKSIIEDPLHCWHTYNPRSFADLRLFIGLVPALFTIGEREVEHELTRLPEGLAEFLTISRLSDHLKEIRDNSSGQPAFEKRFFRWFNMFQIVKYLNYVHSSGFYDRVPVKEAANNLLEMISAPHRELQGEDLLSQYRLLEV